MTEDERDLSEEDGEDQRQGPPVAQGGLVYGLGFLGALVWFWRQADRSEERVLAVLKALVWPALLVYEAFSALQGDSDG